MSDEYPFKFERPSNVDSIPIGRIVGTIWWFGITVIVALVTYCCRRQRRNTETVLSQSIVHQSNYNAVRLPPPPTTRTNQYQTPYIHPPQPTSNAPSEPYANVLPPSYDEVCGKQPPHNQAAY